MKKIILIAIFTIFLSTLYGKGHREVKGLYANSREVKAFINHMIRKYNFKRSYLVKIFSKARVPRPFKYRKIRRKFYRGYIRNRWLKRVGYTAYEKRFLTRDRVIQGVKFVKRYKTLLSKIEKKLKVDKYIVAAIIGIESYYGEVKGRWEAFNVLAYNTFKKKKRKKLFKYELEQLLLLAYRQKLNALMLKGSIYGALGIGQLMPHSYNRYGVSFDSNRRVEPFSYPDSIATVANFLHKKGWQFKKPVAVRAHFKGRWIKSIKSNRVYSLSSLRKRGVKINKKIKARRLKVVKLKRAEFEELWLTFKNFNVLKRYNNSDHYAMAVYQLAQEIKKRVEKGKK